VGGGLDLGFKEAGFELVYACDNDAAAVDCYSRNVDRNVFIKGRYRKGVP
jgi:DNA (cytosine-5)-methyltransferase 1